MFLRDTPGRSAMHREDFLSVAIASNDRFDLLHRVIDAVHQHADMPYEIVVSDDAGHRHPDLFAFQEFRDKVSRIVVNLGCNQGLAVNANHAIAATRARSVVFLSDDSLVKGPFMRRVTTVLDEAPYIGVVYLGQSFTDDVHSEKHSRMQGHLRATTPSGQRVLLHCCHGASWACAFRRDYWIEVGGYAEDDIYGDLPFINKGWARGYLSASLEGPQLAVDLDAEEFGGTRGSVSFQAHGALCHYPRRFGLSEAQQILEALDRTATCSSRNHLGRAEAFNEYDCDAWIEHMRQVTRNGTDWQKLKQFHSRFQAELRRDLRGPNSVETDLGVGEGTGP